MPLITGVRPPGGAATRRFTEIAPIGRGSRMVGAAVAV